VAAGDPHFNLFHAYRGAAANEAARRRQLEDNLTRALGIVLSHVRGTPLAAALLAELGVSPQLRHKLFEVQFQVVAAGASWPSPDHRRLLAIVAGGQEDSPAETAVEPELEGGARPDLVLLWETDALVIESEVTPGPDKAQMNRMHKAFATQGSGAAYRSTTWHSVARVVRDIAPHSPQPTRHVLEQFEEYMRMNGFGGFADEHFAYFAMNTDRRRAESVTRVGARRALKNLLDELKAQ
jgi:hypothetical protein